MKETYTIVGVDGNAFAVIGYVRNAMKRCKKSKEGIDAYSKDAMSSDYNHLLCVSEEMCEKLNNENLDK